MTDPNLTLSYLIRMGEEMEEKQKQIIETMINNHNTMVGILNDLHEIVVEMLQKATPQPEWDTAYFGYVLAILTTALRKMELSLAPALNIDIFEIPISEESHDRE